MAQTAVDGSEVQVALELKREHQAACMRHGVPGRCAMNDTGSLLLALLIERKVM
jgi:hypothetical protein